MSQERTAKPAAVVADSRGRITDLPDFGAAGRSGREFHPLAASSLIPLPDNSRLYRLPGRMAIGSDMTGAAVRIESGHAAVAAFLPPGYTALSLSAYERGRGAPILPLYCYCAVCWYRGRFHVPAVRVDHDPKHDPSSFDMRDVERRVKLRLKAYPGNRLLRHHGMVCALQYNCPNAANLFLERWEAPVAVSGACNAKCLGCISKQDGTRIRSPQERIGFVPTVAEIVEIAVPHLRKAPRAMISFGQGCEGEPLLRGKLIEDAIRAIRRQTRRGTIHMNTNGSLPDVVERLVKAGLNSIRISLNSAREPLYSAYYRCRGYSFADVMDSFRIANRGDAWTSVNYLTFPGVTDDKAEFAALCRLLEKFRPRMIQWRNLNIDPDLYMDIVASVFPPRRSNSIGLAEVMRSLRLNFPRLRHGYFNPPVPPSSSGQR